jgi:hypothetical protein
LIGRAEAGDYFAFCDQDDIWLPDKLRRAASWLDAQPDGVRPDVWRQTAVDHAILRLLMGLRVV